MTAGKGDRFRPVDRRAWEQAWREYCKQNGCKYAGSRMCIYCGKTKVNTNG